MQAAHYALAARPSRDRTVSEQGRNEHNAGPPAQVNEHGNALLDCHVRPKERVTDFRTQFSGVRPGDLRDGIALEDAMARVHALLQGRVVVGHALHNDFKVRVYLPAHSGSQACKRC